MNEAEPTPRHCNIFINNVRGRKQPFADITVGLRSSYIPMMGNIAAKVGKKLKWDAASESFPGETGSKCPDVPRAPQTLGSGGLFLTGFGLHSPKTGAGSLVKLLTDSTRDIA